MILCIQPLLGGAGLATVRRAVANARYRDGQETAGWHARVVKRNHQAEPADMAEAIAIVAQALAAHPVFQSAVLPQRVSPILFNRYEAGMDYGPHVDDAVMNAAGARLRSDVSLTLFLDEPQDYEGSELVIDSAGDEQAYKLAAGACVVYPATHLHSVAPVARGRRWAGRKAWCARRSGARYSSTSTRPAAPCSNSTARTTPSTGWPRPMPICCGSGPNHERRRSS